MPWACPALRDLNVHRGLHDWGLPLLAACLPQLSTCKSEAVVHQTRRYDRPGADGKQGRASFASEKASECLARPTCSCRPETRKLEFLIAEALAGNHDSVVTVGGLQSNHCRATAVAARMAGLEPHLVLLVKDTLADQDPGKCKGRA